MHPSLRIETCTLILWKIRPYASGNINSPSSLPTVNQTERTNEIWAPPCVTIAQHLRGLIKSALMISSHDGTFANLSRIKLLSTSSLLHVPPQVMQHNKYVMLSHTNLDDALSYMFHLKHSSSCCSLPRKRVGGKAQLLSDLVRCSHADNKLYGGVSCA